MRQCDGKSSHYVMSRLWYDGLISFHLMVFFLFWFFSWLVSSFIHFAHASSHVNWHFIFFFSPLFGSLSPLNDCSTNRLRWDLDINFMNKDHIMFQSDWRGTFISICVYTHLHLKISRIMVKICTHNFQATAILNCRIFR